MVYRTLISGGDVSMTANQGLGTVTETRMDMARRNASQAEGECEMGPRMAKETIMFKLSLVPCDQDAKLFEGPKKSGG